MSSELGGLFSLWFQDYSDGEVPQASVDSKHKLNFKIPLFKILEINL